jgi:ABC-type lipoprotein export system ATPase subunit
VKFKDYMNIEPIVQLENVFKEYVGGAGNVVAVRDLTLTIPSGLTVLTGPSGCGKSTLINLIGAFDKPTSGSITVAGQRVDQLDNHKLDKYRRNTVGIVFQFFHLMPALTVLGNVALPGELAGMKTSEARDRAMELLEKVGLRNRVDHRPHELSGGETQRTAIARALVNHPKLVLADEPTGNLDTAASERVMELFATITADEGASALVASHDQDVVRRADRIIQLRDGQLVSS